jgi:hypothetical protein
MGTKEPLPSTEKDYSSFSKPSLCKEYRQVDDPAAGGASFHFAP